MRGAPGLKELVRVVQMPQSHEAVTNGPQHADGHYGGLLMHVVNIVCSMYAVVSILHPTNLFHCWLCCISSDLLDSVASCDFFCLMPEEGYSMLLSPSAPNSND